MLAQLLSLLKFFFFEQTLNIKSLTHVRAGFLQMYVHYGAPGPLCGPQHPLLLSCLGPLSAHPWGLEKSSSGSRGDAGPRPGSGPAHGDGSPAHPDPGGRSSAGAALPTEANVQRPQCPNKLSTKTPGARERGWEGQQASGGCAWRSYLQSPVTRGRKADGAMKGEQRSWV